MPQRIDIRRLSTPTSLRERLVADVTAGFSKSPKELPPKYFYDVEGSGIFEKITELPEYYVTRAETAALVASAADIIQTGGWSRLVELGSGSSKKTRALLEAMFGQTTSGVTYSPFDISESALRDASEELTSDYPELAIRGCVGDFLTSDLDVVLACDEPQLVSFLGSTLGNLTADQRQALYSRFGASVANADGFLVAVDYVKDRSTLEPAYNDSAGVTAEFNKNVLQVLNQELGADIEIEKFRHHAPYIEDLGRIEMRLYAMEDQVIDLSAAALPRYPVVKDEYILTELSQKFTRSGLEDEADQAGLRVQRWWSDPDDLVGLALITR